MGEKSAGLANVIAMLFRGMSWLFSHGVDLVAWLFQGHERWMAVILFVELLGLVVFLAIRSAWSVGILHPNAHDVMEMEAGMKVDKFLIVKRLFELCMGIGLLSVMVGALAPA